MEAAITEQDPVLDEIVRRLIEAYQPERIYLFGSRARGEVGVDSDYDLMVVVPDDALLRDTAAGWPIRCCAGPAERPTSWYAPAPSLTAECTCAPRFRRPSPPKADSYTLSDHGPRPGPRGRSPGLNCQGRARPPGGGARVSSSPTALDDIVFHCQQAAEKALKGFDQAVPLTEYAWKLRYPGEMEEPSRTEAEDALATAHKVYAAIMSRLPPEAQ